MYNTFGSSIRRLLFFQLTILSTLDRRESGARANAEGETSREVD
jgi:hypothetical protein